jgi:ATP-dependent helicase HepA
VSQALSLGHVRVEEDPSDCMADLVQAVEDWRAAATEALIDVPDARYTLVARYHAMLQAIADGAQTFRDWMADTRPVFAGEHEILNALSDLAAANSDNDRIETMVESTRRLVKALRADSDHPKVVAFASSSSVAKAFYTALQADLDGVHCYLLANRDEAADDAVALFRDGAECAVLVVDKSGEEGLNLSFADAIVHLDLPMSAARTEQRIGRLDRYGRRQPIIRHRLLLPCDDETSPWMAWHELLVTGLLIFHRSISDVQFLLNAFEKEAVDALFMSGAGALLPLAATFRERMEEERRSQDEQYALDRIALSEDPVEPFIQALEDAEADETALEKAVEVWYLGALQLKRRPFAWPVEDPFKLAVAKDTLIPRVPWQQSLAIDDTDPLTWKRRIATRDSRVTLLRPGTPLVDVIGRFTRWDDRGTAFITLRQVDRWSADPWVGFKLCFTIEPDLELDDLLAPSSAELAAARRAQRYLPTTRQTLYVDINGEAVSDPSIQALLSRPYSNHRKKEGLDTNLGSRPLLLAEYIDPHLFPAICHRVRDGARSALEAQPDYADAQAAAVRLATSDLERRRSRLLRRQSAGDATARADVALIEAVLPGVAAPAVRLEAMGCFILDQRRPASSSYV